MKTCKRYFKSALGIQDEYSESIHDACHVYLSALYYLSETNQEKTTKHILLLLKVNNGISSRSFVKPCILNYSTLLFVDTVAQVCGFCFLFKHVLQTQNMFSENGFTLTPVVHCLSLSVSQINNKNPSIEIVRMEMTKLKFSKLKFSSPFDICLRAISVHKYRRITQTDNTCEIHECSSNISINLSNNEEEIHFCLEESLEEILMKISVEMFTKYYELQFKTLTQIELPYRCEIVSHFKALYYYRRGEYLKLLNTCDSIISKEISTSEERKHPKFLCVPVGFVYQTLLKNDVICLTGLIELTRSVFGKENVDSPLRPHYQKSVQGKVRGDEPQIFETKVSYLFLVYFLRFQSFLKLHSPKCDILSALDDLIHARTGLEFEDILLMFVGMTLKRLRH